MILDILIIIFLGSSLLRGYRIGLVRQAGSTIGFILGLFVGSFITNHVVGHIAAQNTRSLTSLFIILLTSFFFMTIGELVGINSKQKILTNHSANNLDSSFGSVMSAGTLLVAVWLAASILILSPQSGLQNYIKSSRIIGALNRSLPPATQLLSALNKIIDPNSFPQVFTGLEPHPTTTADLPSLGSLQPAVTKDQTSVVKILGTGCGGIVEGSGFVITGNMVATNAHVVAGVASPKVQDANGTHSTRVVWFDKDVDLAVLQVNGLAGKPLTLQGTDVANGTPGAVLGYPGGGDFTAQPATVTDRFTAVGRDIYGQGRTARDVYSLQAKVIPGNSGGPLIDSNGTVIGVIFATSTQYNNVGYALTGSQVFSELQAAEQSTITYSTGSCSE